ncbi:TIGR00645 family protein [Alsobacter sp. R-9]
MIERTLEKFLFASRWLLAPFYVSLVVALALLLVKTMQEVWHFILHVGEQGEADVILAVLSLIDLTFTGSLIVIVIFSGYENFVSKIDENEHKDWPEWMGKIDFSGLKLKLLSSIVAISAIQLLKAFMNIKNTSDRDLQWLVIVHLVFVGSGVILALTDKISAETKPAKAAK